MLKLEINQSLNNFFHSDLKKCSLLKNFNRKLFIFEELKQLL